MLYEGQSLKNIGRLADYSQNLDEEFEIYKENIRVFN